MSTRIKVLKTNGISGLKVHTLGENGVTKIQDNCIDSPDNYTIQYNVFVDGVLKYSYENGAYELEYEPKPSE